MGIVDEDVVRVREAADIVQVISAHTQLKRVGRSWSGLCPFHGEKTPSFHVDPEKGFFHCFGCNVGDQSLDPSAHLVADRADRTGSLPSRVK